MSAERFPEIAAIGDALPDGTVIDGEIVVLDERGRVVYVNDTGHALHGSFKSFWEVNGGLPVFGYPLTEEFRGADLTVNEWVLDLAMPPGTPAP